ncbi:molybdopterin molybdotransferase MoeA [Pseudoxanthomonas suwonensis]
MTDAFPSRITVEQALELLRAAAAGRGRATEQVPTRRADGRVLAADVVAPIALPAFDNSAMDGFAVRHADLSAAGPVTLELAGEQFAGPDLGLSVGPGQCVRITTGAPLPSGADTIVIREDAVEQDGRVQVPAGIRAGAHVRRQGEDVVAGEVVLRAGQVLTPARIGLAAALGIDRLDVATRPTVAVFASGDELAEPGMPLRPGQVYNSNREQLMAQLRAAGLEPVAWPTLPDDPVLIAAVLDDAVENFDLVLTCGAVSAGRRTTSRAGCRRVAGSGSGRCACARACRCCSARPGGRWCWDCRAIRYRCWRPSMCSGGRCWMHCRDASRALAGARAWPRPGTSATSGWSSCAGAWCRTTTRSCACIRSRPMARTGCTPPLPAMP